MRNRNEEDEREYVENVTQIDSRGICYLFFLYFTVLKCHYCCNNLHLLFKIILSLYFFQKNSILGGPMVMAWPFGSVAAVA